MLIRNRNCCYQVEHNKQFIKAKMKVTYETINSTIERDLFKKKALEKQKKITPT